MFPKPSGSISLPPPQPSTAEVPYGCVGSFVLSDSKVSRLDGTQRVRFIQPGLLHNQELLVRRETFGEKASSLFSRDMYDEILVKNVELDETPTGELFPIFIEGYTTEDLYTDTKNLLQDILALTQNVPSAQTLDSVLEDVPQSARELIRKLFTDTRANYEKTSQQQVTRVQEEERWAAKARRQEEI